MTVREKEDSALTPGLARGRHQDAWMAQLDHIFLDFDGVINDMWRMSRESHLSIAESMTTQHGGDVQQWLGALQRASSTANEWAPGSPLRDKDVVQWLREYDRVWLEELFVAGGVQLPSQGRAELGWHIREEAYRKINCVYADVPEALALLKRSGKEHGDPSGVDGRTLYIASGGRNARLEVLLRKAGLRDYFQEVFGCDTVDVLKESPEYYRRIFDRLNLAPSRSLVVDDNPKCIRWAQEVGAKAALLDRERQQSADADLVSSDLLQLARALEDTD